MEEREENPVSFLKLHLHSHSSIPRQDPNSAVCDFCAGRLSFFTPFLYNAHSTAYAFPVNILIAAAAAAAGKWEMQR